MIEAAQEFLRTRRPAAAVVERRTREQQRAGDREHGQGDAARDGAAEHDEDQSAEYGDRRSDEVEDATKAGCLHASS